MVTTAVPLQAASASNATPNGTASTLRHAPRIEERKLEQGAFIGWGIPLMGYCSAICAAIKAVNRQRSVKSQRSVRWSGPQGESRLSATPRIISFDGFGRHDRGGNVRRIA